MKTEPNDSAFNQAVAPKNQREAETNGLTKREYFAAMAMAGYIQNHASATKQGIENTAEAAVKQADALIKELNK